MAAVVAMVAFVRDLCWRQEDKRQQQPTVRVAF